MIDFYYSPTPNGWKVAIMLAETKLEHRTILMRLPKGDQLTAEFRKINPNAKIPAILDHDGVDGPEPVFESGSILLYLANKTDQYLPQDPKLLRQVTQWLFWQAANQGPMAGQLSHFVNYAPEGQRYSLDRYRGEFERNMAVLENQLADKDYVLGEYTIVDMMTFPWAFISKALGVPLDRYPNVSNWRQRIKSRPAVQQAIDLFKKEQFSDSTSAEQNSVLFNQSAEHLRT